jgi:hypothetical protein
VSDQSQKDTIPFYGVFPIFHGRRLTLNGQRKAFKLDIGIRERGPESPHRG